MDLTTYGPLAIRTNKELGTLGNMVHAALGMASEVGEILEAFPDTESFMEEGGDCLWFANLACHTHGVTLNHVLAEAPPFPVEPVAPLDAVDQMTLAAARYCDLVKKVHVYGKDVAAGDFFLVLGQFLGGLKFIAGCLDTSLEALADGNIAKLEKRYPNLSYDAEHAVNRDKDAEMEALRNATRT